MQYAATDEEHRYYLSYPHHPQRLERGLSAGLRSVGERCDERGMYVAMFSFGAILVRHLAITWQECYGLGDHHRSSLGHLWAFGGTNYGWQELIRSKPNVRLIYNICVLCLLFSKIVTKP